MKNVEVKKLVYKQKPLAHFSKIRMGIAYYRSFVIDENNKSVHIEFHIPVADMGDADFTKTMEAKLLVRWLVDLE